MTVLKRVAAVALGTTVVGGMLLTNANADPTVVLNNGNHETLGWSGTVDGDGYAAEVGASIAQGNNTQNPKLANGLFVMGVYQGDTDQVILQTDNYDGMQPDDLTAMSYSSYRWASCQVNSDVDAGNIAHIRNRPTFQMEISGPHSSGLFDEFKTTIVYEPYYDSNPDSHFAYNQWRIFNGLDGGPGWWSTKTISDQITINGQDTNGHTYAQILSALPDDWYVSLVKYQLGHGPNGDFRVCAGLDNMTIQVNDPDFVSATYDWEAPLTTTTTAVDVSNAKKLKVEADDTTVDEFGNATFTAHLEWLDANGDSFDPLRTPADPTAGGNADGVPGYFGIPANPVGQGRDGVRVDFTIGQRVLCRAFSDANGVATCSVKGDALLPSLFSDSDDFVAYHPPSTDWLEAWDEATVNYAGLLL